MINADLAEAARDTLVARGIEVRGELVSLPSRPYVLSDLAGVAVKLHASRDDAWDEVYWLRILGDGGVPVVPLLVNEVVPILDRFGVVTHYLSPDEANERDAPAVRRVMRQVHDIALDYLEEDGTTRIPLPSALVLSQGVLHVAGIDGVERR